LRLVHHRYGGFMGSLKFGSVVGLLVGLLIQGNAIGGNGNNSARRESPDRLHSRDGISNSGADTSVNIPVCVATGWQTAPVVVKDGVGGSIIFWQDQRKGTNVYTTDFDIYSQRLNAAGEPRWTQDGIPIAVDALFDIYPRAVSDGRGGAVVVWWTETLANTSFAIRAQRIDSTGALRWAPGGVIVDSYLNAGSKDYDIASDGEGGVIIASQVYPVNPPEAFAQRVDSTGALRWGLHGVPLAPSGPAGQDVVCAAPDGAGGVIVGMQDFRYPGTDSAGSFFMQRVDSSGTLLWGQGGVGISNHGLLEASMITHIQGDYVALWLQRPWPTEPSVNRLMAQRLDGEGKPRWPQYGVPVTPTPAHDQIHPGLCDDRRRGAIISWEESKDGIMTVLAGRLDSSGTRQWADSGITLVRENTNEDPLPQIVENGKGGAFVIWLDYRNAVIDLTNVDIFGQGIGTDGSLAWQAGGIAVSSAPKAQKFSYYYNRGIALTDTTGVAVVAWEDARDSTASKKDPGQIYAARMVYPPGAVAGISGGQGITVGTFGLDQNYPNPFNPSTTIGYRLPVREHVSLAVYNVLGEKIATLVDEEGSAGPHKVIFNGTGFASGVYFYSLRAGNSVQTHKFMLLR
jgi:hypothetical protein